MSEADSRFGWMTEPMTPAEQTVYDATAATAMLLSHLEQDGALNISLDKAAAKAVELYDNLAAHGYWPADWQDHAHVDLLDTAQA